MLLCTVAKEKPTVKSRTDNEKRLGMCLRCAITVGNVPQIYMAVNAALRSKEIEVAFTLHFSWLLMLLVLAHLLYIFFVPPESMLSSQIACVIACIIRVRLPKMYALCTESHCYSLTCCCDLRFLSFIAVHALMGTLTESVLVFFHSPSSK